MARHRKPKPGLAPLPPRAARAVDRPALTEETLYLIGLAVVYAGYLAYAIPYLSICLRAPWPGGWDGIGHFAIADLYASKIFPSISGWLPEYFSGMPFPNFYPPLFYLIAALLSFVVGSAAAVWMVLVASTLAIPWLIHRCARELTSSPIASFVAAALASGFMMDEQLPSFLGISLHSTFDIGLFSQPLSFCFLLLAYHAFLRSEREPRATLSASLWLAAVVLSNVHVVWNAALLFGAHTIAELIGDRTGRRRVLARSVSIIAVAGLVSSCWLVPMVAHLAWVPTVALPPPPPRHFVLVLTRDVVYTAMAGVGALIGTRSRRVLALVAALFAMMLFGFLSLLAGLKDLPLQPGRVLVGCELLVTLAIGSLVAQARLLSSWRGTTPVAALVAIAIVSMRWTPVHEPKAQVRDGEALNYAAVLAALEGHTDARVLAEHGNTLGNGFAMQALIGRAGLRSATTIFRESSPMALFAVPLRNILSEHREEYGVDTKLPKRRLSSPSLNAENLARLRWLGVRYLVARSPDLKAVLQHSSAVERLSPTAEWEAWMVRAPMGPLAAVPKRAPVLTFSAVSVKRRADHALDFMRIGEEAFVAARLDHVFVHAPSELLDTSPEWERFDTALIVDYRYRDLEAAYRVLERYSQAHALLLVESPDPLYKRLAALAPAHPLLRLIARERPASVDETLPALDLMNAQQDADYEATRKECARIFDALDAVAPPLVDPPHVVSAELEHDHATVTLSAAPSRPVPVWIQQSYFPLWRGERGQPIYLASPAYTLTFATSEQTVLRYVSGDAEQLGWALFALGVVAAVVVWRRSRREATRSLVT